MLRRKKNKQSELLEVLAVKAGCIYLSDLHEPFYQKKLSQVCNEIEPDAYSLKEWNEAVDYILNVQIEHPSCTAAATYLIEHIEK